jgi:hypothetical protein
MYTFEDCVKDPQSVESKTIDWSDYLIQGDEISLSTWSVTSPSGDLAPIEVDIDSIEEGMVGEAALDIYTVAVLSGGTLGNSYVVRNHITTVQGYEMDGSIYFRTDSK